MLIVLQVDNPLDQAIKFLKPLQLLASKRIETHLMAFEIYERKGKSILRMLYFRDFEEKYAIF